MADWLRSPSQRWFVNNHWVKYAFEKTRKENVQWNSFYGQKGLRFTTPGVNKDNPNYNYRGSDSCSTCELFNNQSGCPGSAAALLCQYINTIICDAGCDDSKCWCAFPPDCFDGEGGLEEVPCADGRDPRWDCNTPCLSNPGEFDCLVACSQDPDCDGCGPDPTEPDGLCLGKNGDIVPCRDDRALCNPCTGGCDDVVVCPCGDASNGFGGCVIQPPGSQCPAICCIPNEPGCVECCPEGEEGCGNYIPEDMCGEGDPGGCNPGGTPYSSSFCEGCEICNIYPDLPQCRTCCRCDGVGPYVDCDDLDCGDPPTCPDFTSNCYSCGDKLIPIWFECEEADPCPNPFNPDCTIGDEIVCYEYNTNDPIYYNASNTGATVIKEYDNPVAGGTYGYGNVATICDVPDEFQLCVYGVTSGGAATKLTYQATLSGTGTTWTLDTNDNVILNSSGNFDGYTKLRISRCTDDTKMFLTFSDGAKLSADDLNKTFHQLLFLIQEKEFAANSYVQLQNAIGLGANISWDFDSSNGTAAVATITVADAGAILDGQNIVITDTAGTSHTFVFEDSNNNTTGNSIGIQTAKAGSDENAAATQIAATINAGTCGGTITAVANNTVVTLTQDVVGHQGNRTNTTTTTTVAVGNFTGAVDFSGSDFDGYTFTLTAYDSNGNTTKTYQFDDSGSPATGNLIGSNVCIQYNGIFNFPALLTQIEAAISNSTNGHGTKFATKQFTTDSLNDSLSITQKVVGPNGNLAIPHSAGLDSVMVTPLWQFVNGVDYDTTKPMITFDPPVELPITFDLSSTSINNVLGWDGNGSFTTQRPDQIARNIQLDNLNGITLTSTSLDDFLYFDGSKWVNRDFSTAVGSVINARNFSSIESYDVTANSTLDDYFVASCDAALKTLWAAAGTCVTNLSYEMIPNAITSFGLGYYAAERQIYNQVTTTNSTLDSFVKEQVAASLEGGGTVLSSLRWEIGRGEGRVIAGAQAPYPQAYFDVLDFDVLDHPTSAGNGGIGDPGVLDGEGANAPSGPNSDTAYFRNWGAGICPLCRNKIYLNKIDKFKFNGTKSSTFGLEGNSVTGSTSNSYPVTDRYLKRIRSAINKTNWGTELGYAADRHPLKNYPNNSVAEGNAAYPASYTDFVDSNEMIFGSYLYNTTDTANAVWGSTKHLPTVVTYYLAQLWDGSAGLAGAPSFIQWDGSIDMAGNIDNMTDAGNNYTGGTSVPVYLDTASNRHYYWRWLITGKNTSGAGSNTNVAVYNDLSYYSPFDSAKLTLDNTNSVLPASSNSGESTDPANENDLMAKTGAYSIKFDANKVFSNMERILPDMYDEYVFEVQLDVDARRSSTTVCPDGLCYEVQAKIEKYVDGCAEDGDTDCTKIGSASGDNNGYHVYPRDFDADVVAAWDTYPYDKLKLEVRNKTAVGFDLVIHAPRLKRIGIIDVYRDGRDTDDSGSDDAYHYRQLALDFVTSYVATEWDDNSAAGANPHGNADTTNSPPILQQVLTESPAAFSLETALQFVRLGLPSNIRVAFQTITTPQKRLFGE